MSVSIPQPTLGTQMRVGRVCYLPDGLGQGLTNFLERGQMANI